MHCNFFQSVTYNDWCWEITKDHHHLISQRANIHAQASDDCFISWTRVYFCRLADDSYHTFHLWFDVSYHSSASVRVHACLWLVCRRGLTVNLIANERQDWHTGYKAKIISYNKWNASQKCTVINTIASSTVLVVVVEITVTLADQHI